MTTQVLESIIERLVEDQVKEREDNITKMKCVSHNNKVVKHHMMKDLQVKEKSVKLLKEENNKLRVNINIKQKSLDTIKSLQKDTKKKNREFIKEDIKIRNLYNDTLEKITQYNTEMNVKENKIAKI